MKHTSPWIARVVGGGALLLLALAGPNLAHGADHTDSPAATAEPLADIADLYAWMSADAADLNLIMLYRDAVARLPQYVVANVHLSELEDSAAAIPRLEAIAYTAGDPEPAGRLAQRLEARDPARALTLALENVALRPVPRAYLVAIGAALEADALETACALVVESTPWHAQHVVLAERAAELARRCR